MKNTLLLYLFLFISPLCKSQDIENLYLISGHPYGGTDAEFASYLWRYSENSLDTISLLSSKDDHLENVKVYPEQNLTVVHKINAVGRRHLNDNHRILFIDYKESIKFSETPVDIQGSFKYYLSLKNENLLLLSMFSNERGLHFQQIDIKSLNIKKADLHSFTQIKLTGIPGGGIYGSDYRLVYTNKTTGSLEISLVGEREKRPLFPYVLPERYQFNAYERHAVYINNSKTFVLNGNYDKPSNTVGTSNLIILNKENNSWNKLNIPGNIQNPRGFGEWICGYVINDHIKGKKLPGADKWTARESGLSPKVRWTYFPDYDYVYLPGILYFYNAYTKEYFELETNQADSEVILIQDETIIYRVYDELYIAKIINGQKLGKAKLLLKDDRVPDIHWAFWGGE